jgi:hypothetical protein
MTYYIEYQLFRINGTYIDQIMLVDIIEFFYGT